MSPHSSERGFALTEILIASVITLVVMGVAFSTFRDGLSLNDSAMKVTDASQNLRAGTNLLVRDLLQVGRNMPTGGIPIPTGGPAVPVKRPSPPSTSYTFLSTPGTTLRSLTTGSDLGPIVSGRRTDMVTLLMADPLLTPLSVGSSVSAGTGPKLAVDGSSIALGDQATWVNGNQLDGIAPVAVGDILYFLNPNGSTIQTVTRMDATNVYFENNDVFMLNQRNATSGSITQILGNVTTTVRRVLMITYYVHEATAGQPRLMRALNMHPAQALAGVVEDLQFQYDLVDGSNTVSNVDGVPYTVSGLTYTASQIRKVKISIGVRSETRSQATRDYMRHYVTTVTSLRNLAYVNRYD